MVLNALHGLFRGSSKRFGALWSPRKAFLEPRLLAQRLQELTAQQGPLPLELETRRLAAVVHETL